MNRAAVHARPLNEEEQRRLLAQVAAHPRALVLYTLALRCGLGADDLSALDIRDVSPDGRHPHPVLHIGRKELPLFGEALGTEVHRIVSQYLGNRCACVHLRLPLRSYRDQSGVQRCHVCHDDLDVLANPLFLSRRRQRLSPKRIRNEFAQHRDQAGLDRRVRFSFLRLNWARPSGEWP